MTMNFNQVHRLFLLMLWKKNKCNVFYYISKESFYNIKNYFRIIFLCLSNEYSVVNMLLRMKVKLQWQCGWPLPESLLFTYWMMCFIWFGRVLIASIEEKGNNTVDYNNAGIHILMTEALVGVDDSCDQECLKDKLMQATEQSDILRGWQVNFLLSLLLFFSLRYFLE